MVLADPARGKVILWSVIAAGAVLRVAQYLDRRSVWIDEAMLSLNVASRSYRGLLNPLDYDQIAPAPFLLAQRFLAESFGVNELSLRLLSLLAGILLTPLMWELARRVLPSSHALVATTLVAFSPTLLRYSNEAKSYGIDALVVVALSIVAIDLVRAPSNRRSWFRLLMGGLVAAVVTIPAPFALTGIGLALFAAPSMRRTRHAPHRIALLGATWFAACSAVYFGFYQVAARGEYMREFWELAFLRPGAPDLGARAWVAMNGVFSGMLLGTLDAGRWGAAVMAGAAGQAAVGAALCTAGAVGLGRRHGTWMAALLCGPAIAAVLASGVGAYPITVRLMLFAVPGLFIALTQGIHDASTLVAMRWRKAVVISTVAGFVLPQIARGLMTMAEPIRQQDTRPVLAELSRRQRAGDPVYIYAPALPSWAFYTTNWTAPDTTWLRWVALQATSGGQAFHSAPSRRLVAGGEGTDLEYRRQGRLELVGLATGRPLQWGGGDSGGAPDSGWAENEAARIARAGPRTWVFFMPLYPGDRMPNLQQLQRALHERGGAITYEYHRREADLYLYEFQKRRK